MKGKSEEFHTDCLKRNVKFPASLMIWGCMSAQGVCGWFYQFCKDGASCPYHTARTTKTWLLAKIIPTIEWQSNSPDLSPIETLWWKMKKVLRKSPLRST